MNILQVLEMVSIDGAQFEEVMEAVARVDRFGTRKPISAEAISPTPLHFDLIEAGLVPADMSIRSVVLRRGHTVFESPTTPLELEHALAKGGIHRDRIEWRRANWGMAEDFLDAEEWGARRHGAIRFSTRDAIPYQIYEALSEKFIDPQFQIRWLDEESGLAGMIVYQMGYCLEELTYGPESSEYAEVRDYVKNLTEGRSEPIRFPPGFANLG